MPRHTAQSCQKTGSSYFFGSFNALVIVTALNLTPCFSFKNLLMARALIRSFAPKMDGNNSTTRPRLPSRSADFRVLHQGLPDGRHAYNIFFYIRHVYKLTKLSFVSITYFCLFLSVWLSPWRKDFRAVHFAPITKDFAPTRQWRDQSGVTVLRAAFGDSPPGHAAFGARRLRLLIDSGGRNDFVGLLHSVRLRREHSASTAQRVTFGQTTCPAPDFSLAHRLSG